MNTIKLSSLFVAGALLSGCIGSPPDATSDGSDAEVGEAREALTIPGGAFQDRNLNAGDSVYSPDGRTYLAMQSDGNLVLYYSPFATWSQPIWSTGTYGNPGAYAAMQSDGNLVVYKKVCIQVAGGTQNLCGLNVLWASGTNKGSENIAEVQDDGNFVIYQTSGNVIGGPLWASNTNNVVPPKSICFPHFCPMGSWWHTCDNEGDGTIGCSQPDRCDTSTYGCANNIDGNDEAVSCTNNLGHLVCTLSTGQTVDYVVASGCQYCTN